MVGHTSSGVGRQKPLELISAEPQPACSQQLSSAAVAAVLVIVTWRPITMHTNHQPASTSRHCGRDRYQDGRSAKLVLAPSMHSAVQLQLLLLLRLPLLVDIRCPIHQSGQGADLNL